MTHRSLTDTLAALLSDGLDLAVRARKLDEVVETISPDHPDNPLSHDVRRVKCGTPAIWVMDQYDTDLADWERRARETLSKHGLMK